MDPIEKKVLEVASDISKGLLNKLLGPTAEYLGQGLKNYVAYKLKDSPYWGEDVQKKQTVN